jgi:hypothetical protein
MEGVFASIIIDRGEDGTEQMATILPSVPTPGAFVLDTKTGTYRVTKVIADTDFIPSPAHEPARESDVRRNVNMKLIVWVEPVPTIDP